MDPQETIVEQGQKFYVGGKDKKKASTPRIIVAANKESALKAWARETNREASEGVASEIGTQHATIMRSTKQDATVPERNLKSTGSTSEQVNPLEKE